MKLFLAPAVNMAPAHSPTPPTIPLFCAEAKELAERLAAYSPWELESLLGTGPKLALQAYDQYQAFAGDAAGTPALLAYQGLAYRHLAPGDFSAEDMAFAGCHLYILSALYGLLTATDGIRPYRLDFLCRYARSFMDGEGLYRFWGDRVYRALFHGGAPVVNLSSGEYAKLVVPHLQPGDRMVTCRFLTERRGKLRCPSTAAKMARGRMARFAMKNRITDPQGLEAFEEGDFQFCRRLSAPAELVFLQRG